MAQRRLDHLVKHINAVTDELDTCDDGQIAALWHLKVAAEKAQRVAYGRSQVLSDDEMPLMQRVGSNRSSQSLPSSAEFEDAVGPDEN